MERIRAFVPWTFFEKLLPFNAELLNDNAMLVRACGTKPADGSVLRSKSFLLFGRGLATLLPQAGTLAQGLNGKKGYVMEFVHKRDSRKVDYWEAQIASDQTQSPQNWEIEVSSFEPDPDDGIQLPLPFGLVLIGFFRKIFVKIYLVNS